MFKHIVAVIVLSLASVTAHAGSMGMDLKEDWICMEGSDPVFYGETVKGGKVVQVCEAMDGQHVIYTFGKIGQTPELELSLDRSQVKVKNNAQVLELANGNTIYSMTDYPAALTVRQNGKVLATIALKEYTVRQYIKFLN